MAVKRSQSGARILAVLEAIAAQQPIGVRALAKAMACDKSAIQRAIMTLSDEGWVRQTAESPPRWQLTSRLAAVAQLAQGGDDLRQRARPLLELLREQTGETAMLVVPEGDRFVIAEVAESRHLLRMAPHAGLEVGVRGTATGRAILAYLDPVRQRDMLGKTPDKATLAACAAARRQGFAVSEGEVNPDASSLAAPIFDSDGAPVAALVITGPRGRLSKVDYAAIGAQLAQAAARLSRGQPDR